MQLNELLLPAAWVKVPAGQLVHEPLPVLTEYVLNGHTAYAETKAPRWVSHGLGLQKTALEQRTLAGRAVAGAVRAARAR